MHINFLPGNVSINIDARPPSGPIIFRMSGINMASPRERKNHTTDSNRALTVRLHSNIINLHPVTECISLMMLSKANLWVKMISYVIIFITTELVIHPIYLHYLSCNIKVVTMCTICQRLLPNIEVTFTVKLAML